MTKFAFIISRCIFTHLVILVIHNVDSIPLRSESPVFKGLPHCAKSTVVSGEIIHQNLETAQIKVLTTVSLRLGLNQTACLHVQVPNTDKSDVDTESFMYNGSLLYTIKYKSLRHEHPVRQKYDFAIPRLRSSCVCDCSGGDDHCSVGFQYHNCSQKTAGVCHTTYHAHQRATGCPHGTQSELCCEISAQPYKDWEFTAAKIGPPETVALYEYSLYTYFDGVWTKTMDNELEIVLNQDQKFFLGEQDTVSLSVRGDSPRRQLSSGMYFKSSKSVALRTGVPLNQLHEWSMHKLGWFRHIAHDKERSKYWEIRGGGLKLQEKHHVSVQNCKSQLYTDSYNAEFLVSVGRSLAPDDALRSEVETLKFHLGHTIESVEPWIKRAFLNEREAIVVHESGAPLTVNIELSAQSTIRFLHHSSAFNNFAGAIQLDKYSNRFLNVTFYDARGSLIGTVYKDSDISKGVDLAFSTYIGTPVLSNYSTILSLPASVNGSRWVCFHPSQRNQDEICKWLRFESTPLFWFEVPHNWNSNQGDCQGCNQMNINNFMRHLDPRQWLDGFSGTSEIIAFAFEVTLYIVILLIIVTVCRKCICPLLKWTICSFSSSKKTNISSDS